MGVPKAAVAYYNRVDRLGARAKKSASEAFRQVDSKNIRESWQYMSGLLAVSVAAGQVRAADEGASYGAQTLASQGLYEPPAGFVNPQAFGGYSTNGAPLDRALYAAAPFALQRIANGSSVGSALRSGEVMAGQIAQSMVTDAGRSAAGVDTYARQGVGYVRMVNPGACDRCIILAGKYYRNNEGFLRHPNCYCIHVQTNVKAAEDEGLIAEPYEYFNSLSEDAQNKAFTKSGAQAIRDGADINQVVNSRKGMSYAGVSRDGTRRGQRAKDTTVAGSSRRAHTGGIKNRLTPDAIYRQGLPREQTLQLLREQGYLLPQGQVPGGGIVGPDRFAGTAGRMTAAQQRTQTATLQWEAVQEGRNPYGTGPLTPKVAAQIEDNYRRWITSGGQIYTR